jgi:molybdopterin-guanine dinucleotide biosynthesis protein A
VHKNRIVSVIINFKTPDLTHRAVSGLRRFYPDLPLLLIDNGSSGPSAAALDGLRELSPDRTEVILNRRNIHHGPAMDQALRHLDAELVLFLDSDCEVVQGGFVEAMTERAAQSPECYAVGKLVFMNKRGFDVDRTANGALPYIRPVCMLINRELYLTLPAFEHHGTPCLNNMREAARRGLSLVDFPTERYVRHEGRGTAARYGYRLGLKGKLNYLLNKFGW